MPEAILKFNLPDDQYEFHVATRGGDYLRILWGLTQEFRSKAKHGTPQETTWGEVYDFLWEQFKEENFDPFTEGE